MNLKCLGSSSKGNSYILTSGDETLLIECGVKLSKIKEALDFNLSSIVGALCTHQHRDHSKYIKDFMDGGITILANEDVFESHKIKDHFRAKTILPGKGYKLGNFKIITFIVYHDVPCMGFHIYHPEVGNILFATDTFMIDHSFENINHAIIECNYADDILNSNIEKGLLPMIMKVRLMNTHMSLGTCLLFLKNIMNPGLKNIILIHLSDGNSDEKRFVREITEEFGVNTVAGDKEITVDLSLIPY